MQERTGLPIAAYMGMLVALALAAAFVATLAIVIFLPPRPPDVMRADTVSEHFQDGYDHMIALGRAPNERGMIWEVREDAPERSDSPFMHMTQHQLASALELPPNQVRVAAEQVTTDDAFVFRVRDIAEAVGEANIAAAEVERVAAEVERVQEAAEARAEAARARAMAAAEEREEMHLERAMEAEHARLEALARRQAEAAERQARAAERLAARIENRIRIEQGRVIISRDGEPDVDVDVDVDIDEEDLESRLEVLEIPRVRVIAPPAPAEAAAPPSPPARTQAPTPPAPRVSPTPPMFAPAPAGVLLISGFEFGAQLPDGRWLVMRQGRNWAEIGWIGRAALVIGGTLAVVSLLALLFARRLTRPIRNFSEAVQAVGVNPQSEPVREEGPRELRGAARAVNTMQARLRALIADRTKTLAAVAHDMRTPLMRLRLTAENAPPDQRERMAKEIEEVEALVASFIAFARDDPAEEPRVRVDLAALLQSIAYDHAEHGRNVSFEGEERLIVTGQSLGLKRLFSNLVENALKYGSCARIKLQAGEGAVVADVEDDGPGVPADQRQSVFEPFVRLNEEGTRGAGLGLAAARSIARAHGGDIAIMDADKGALVRVTLPA